MNKEMRIQAELSAAEASRVNRKITSSGSFLCQQFQDVEATFEEKKNILKELIMEHKQKLENLKQAKLALGLI